MIALQHTKQLYALARHEQYSRHIIGTDGSWMGRVICWENLVHRVKTSDEPGFALHLFSDDPSRGQHFRLSS